MTALAMVLGVLQLAALGQEKPTFDVSDFGITPRLWGVLVVIEDEAVQRELKLTDAQQKELRGFSEKYRRDLQRQVQEARRKARGGPVVVAASLVNEAHATIRGILRPEQWQRLEQIKLQADGPLAFDRRGDDGLPARVQNASPPLAERLELTDDQVKRIRTTIEQGNQEISKAARFPIPLDPRDRPTAEAIRKLVQSPEFQESKQKARQAARDAWAAVIHHIEDILTEPQRQEYHRLIGAPFDLSRLSSYPPRNQPESDINTVARALNLGGAQGLGQRSDPNFNTKVAYPAYATGSRHPRVLFDEAHLNFHTADGRYKPFAELMTSDGYQVIPNRDRFNREFLARGDILVIANARSSGEGRGDSAFTGSECDAVRDWVQDGGSLLLITDHAPFGSAARVLAQRFGVAVSSGVVSDPDHSDERPAFLVFSRQNHLLGDHPITRGRDDSERVNKVQTFTGTSLKGPEGSVPILKLADSAVDNSFDEERKATAAAGRAQGTAFAFGKGRVVVMGEAAELSAQLSGLDRKIGMNVPGIDNRQMALNIMHWLSGLLEPRKAALKKAG